MNQDMNALNNKGKVIWLTGLPCSGKTSIAKEVEKYFIKHKLPIKRLDGNVIRSTVNKKLSFSKKDRDENIKKAGNIAKSLADDGINVVAAFVSPYEKTRGYIRKICPNFVEVYTKCDVKECIRRDVKGEYKKALSGEIKNFTGIQDPYEEPEKPELIINTKQYSLKESVAKLIKLLDNLN